MTTNELFAVIDTNRGTIRLRLFADLAPLTVANFINLAQRNYYQGLKFHRVIADFMIQGGCPYGTGSGGPGYTFEDEFCQELRHDKPGILSMANAGPRTNGSQFFITHIPTAWLDRKHSIFGEVATEADMEVVNAIRQTDAINQITIEGDASTLLADHQARIDEWNVALDRSFPKLSEK